MINAFVPTYYALTVISEKVNDTFRGSTIVRLMKLTLMLIF